MRKSRAKIESGNYGREIASINVSIGSHCFVCEETRAEE